MIYILYTILWCEYKKLLIILKQQKKKRKLILIVDKAYKWKFLYLWLKSVGLKISLMSKSKSQDKVKMPEIDDQILKIFEIKKVRIFLEYKFIIKLSGSSVMVKHMIPDILQSKSKFTFTTKVIIFNCKSYCLYIIYFMRDFLEDGWNLL